MKQYKKHHLLHLCGLLAAVLLCMPLLAQTEEADYSLAAGYVYADGGEKDSRGAEAAEPVWTVVFADQNGDPVPGCVALFCTDVNCTTVVADDNGRAEFHGEPFAYHVQVLTVPDGYSVAPGAEFTMEENGGTVTVDVTKG